MVINHKMIKADKKLCKIIDDAIGDVLKKDGKRISITKMSKRVADIIESRKEELLEDKFIKF